MHIEAVHIEGFRNLRLFDIALDEHLNVLVGDNECGKSSLLEAINLALTGQIDGRSIFYEIDPYVFNNDDVTDYFSRLKITPNAAPPRVLIEVYLNNDGSSATGRLKGSNNSKKQDTPGISLTIELDKDLATEFQSYVISPDSPALVPVEYYSVSWHSFSGNPINSKRPPLRVAVIDTSLTRTVFEPHRFIARQVSTFLNPQQQRSLSLAYRKLRHSFANEQHVKAINAQLHTTGTAITSKTLSVSMDMSARSTWDSSITAHLDDVPFALIGKGEQSRVRMKLAIQAANECNVLLIEEPENHLSHSNMCRLIDEIRDRSMGKQVIVTTHSSFVLNKLGLDNIKLLSSQSNPLTLTQLDPDTRDYFMKLPGYNTLRLILARKSILVEGPSDELVVQKAYKAIHGKLPLDDGVDVIAVGLAFRRFLEIAHRLNLHVAVVADNDGDVAALQKKFATYLQGMTPKITVSFDKDQNCKTLEPQFIRANALHILNNILQTTCATVADLEDFMTKNKTEWALQVFLSDEPVGYPQYILDAIHA